MLKNYGKSTKMEDPIIHFYEDFLSEYDPKLRKARGVWYTPAPVVNFIVRAVDDILKTEFDMPMGLADTSKTKIMLNTQTPDKRSATGYKQIEQDVHRVQILDPATGTATFLAEVIKHIHKKFEGQQGIWSNYVESHLIPRLNGFELLMASYAMAHLKLDLLLKETGFKPTKEQRFRVFLTNSLEEHHPDTGTLFANWLSTEANEANRVKRDTPVMCILGNPPYSVSSSNKSEWIEALTADYKKDMKERNIQPLSDDYIKFIRFGQHFIDKNGSGILAYISNNSFVDGIIHRQMRKNLLESFDKIYILDLHGNSKKQEVCPDGSTDENVFDIMQGVSINIFVKTGTKKKNELGKVFHFDLQGKRELKYDFLRENSYLKLNWNELKHESPNYFFTKKDFSFSLIYEKYISLDNLFNQKSSGIETRKDSLVISESKKYLENVITDFRDLQDDILKIKYKIDNNSRDWKVESAKQDILKNNPTIRKIQYRPFDNRLIIYTGYTKGINGYPMYKNFKHFICSENIGLTYERQCVIGDFTNIIISNSLVDGHILGTAFSKGYTAPLYIYPDINAQQTIDQTTERTPNLNIEIVNQIAEKLGLRFTNEKEADENTFAPIDLLDYIYAVLHSPTYREKYKEFLKIDFPRVPYPRGKETFWQLVKLGGEIRQIHLLESSTVEKYITQYPIDGTNEVGKPKYENGKVYINETQYFDNVPEIAWNFFIGGYQPAQKWLKDRKERTLEFEDILHYQKIIVALTETDRLMKEIDKIEIE
jgi:predicted helicase